MRHEGYQREAGPQACQHVLCRAPEFINADVDAALYSSNERVQQKDRQSPSRGGALLRLLQLLPRPPNPARHSSDGSWIGRTCLDAGRIGITSRPRKISRCLTQNHILLTWNIHQTTILALCRPTRFLKPE